MQWCFPMGDVSYSTMNQFSLALLSLRLATMSIACYATVLGDIFRLGSLDTHVTVRHNHFTAQYVHHLIIVILNLIYCLKNTQKAAIIHHLWLKLCVKSTSWHKWAVRTLGWLAAWCITWRIAFVAGTYIWPLMHKTRGNVGRGRPKYVCPSSGCSRTYVTVMLYILARAHTKPWISLYALFGPSGTTAKVVYTMLPYHGMSSSLCVLVVFVHYCMH